VFDELRQGVEDLATLSDPNAATLRIGSSPANEAGLVPRVIERLARRFPRMRFIISTGTTASRMEALRERRVDIWVARAHTDDPGPDFQFDPLMHERLLVVTSRTSPWAKRPKPSLSALAKAPWIIAQPELMQGSPVRRAFAAEGLALPETLIISDSLNFRLSMLQTGQHVTFMPDSAVLLAPPLPWLRVLPIALPRWHLPVVVATLRHRRPTAAASLFIAEAHAVIREIAAQDPTMLPARPD